MNKLERSFERNRNARLLEHSSKMHRNCIRFGKGETDEHFFKKCKVAWMLKQMGHSFVVEAKFNGGKYIADVYDLDSRSAYEVTVNSPCTPAKVAFYEMKGITMREV